MADAAPVHQEAHALVNAFVECEHWFAQGHVHIRSDHRPLLWLLRTAEVSPKLWGGKAVCWVLLLQNFSWTLTHVAGDENVAPDALSRMHWSDSHEILRRDQSAQMSAKAARRRPVQIQRRLDDLDANLEDEEEPSDEELLESERLERPHCPQPPLGLTVDVFETVAMALLQDLPVPAEFEDPKFANTLRAVRQWIHELELRSYRLFHKYLGVYVRAEERDSVLF